MVLRSFLYTLFIICLVFKTEAKIVLPSVLSDNMVLQQNSNVNLWGTASKNKDVVIITSWNKQTIKTKANVNGEFSVKVNTPAAGGPFQISFKDDNSSVTLQNVMLGEVWLCAGQSNMEMPMRGFPNQPILNSVDILMSANNPQLRLMKVVRAPSLTPQGNINGDWKESTVESAREFSAVAYQFGAMLQKQLNVPVGIIVSAVGGTRIECWMGNELLKNFPEVKVLTDLAAAKQDFKEPTVLFNSMIYPLRNFAVKGFLWYQGESNRNNIEGYKKYLPAMVKDWRKHWGLGEIPFYYAELAPFGNNDKTDGVEMRCAQLKAMDNIPNSGMATTLDIGMQKYIHPMDKTKLALRLGFWALGNTYAFKGVNYKIPVYKSHTIEGDKALVIFDHFANGITSFGKEMSLFELAGEDNKFYPAKAEILKDGKVELGSSEVKEPKNLRYAWKNWVVGELFNTDGLPIPSFKTDK